MPDQYGPPGGNTLQGGPVYQQLSARGEAILPPALGYPGYPGTHAGLPTEVLVRSYGPGTVPAPRRPGASTWLPEPAPVRAMLEPPSTRPHRRVRVVVVVGIVMLVVGGLGAMGYSAWYANAVDDRTKYMQYQFPLLSSGDWECSDASAAGRPGPSEVTIRCTRGKYDLWATYSPSGDAAKQARNSLDETRSGFATPRERSWEHTKDATRLTWPPGAGTDGGSDARTQYIYESGYVVDVFGPTLAGIDKTATRWLPQHPHADLD
jgi:hypothetical protein